MNEIRRIDINLSTVVNRVNSLETCRNTPESDTKRIVIIRILPVGRHEADDTNVLRNRVNQVMRDGLKLKYVKVVGSTRKARTDSKPGTVICTVEGSEKKRKLVQKYTRKQLNQS